MISSLQHNFTAATVRSIGMALAIPHTMSVAMLRRLHRLAEQRCAYFVDLYQSGRWSRYYTSEELATQMREAAQVAERLQQMLEAATLMDRTQVPNVVPLFAQAS